MAVTGQAALAVEVTTEQSEGSSVNSERSYSGKTNKEDKDSTGHKRSKSHTTGSDLTTTDSAKRSATGTRGHSLDTQASLMMLFEATLDELAPLPPVMPGDIGLSAETSPSWIDTVIGHQINPHMATSNAPLRDAGVNLDTVTRYALDVANRGAIAAQAARYLADDIARLGGKKPAKGGEFEITVLGADDLERLAGGAVRRVFDKSGKPIITDPDLKRKFKSIKDRIERGRDTWRFAGAIDKMTPGGGVELQLAIAPTLAASGAKWYAPTDSSFGGYSVAYKVSSSWSLADSLEALKSDSRYTKQALELSAYCERLDATGHNQEAAATRKQAVEASEHNKASLNPFKFLHMPGAGGGGE